MVLSQDAHTVGEHPLEQGDRLTQAPHRLVGAREVAPGGKRVGVVLSQNPHTVGEHLLVQGDRLTEAAH